MSIYLPSLLDKFKDFVNGLKANWEDYVDHINNTTDAHGIDEHVAATAEDDVHGLAGAVIVDSGSNDNGSWVRFGNGLQICWTYVYVWPDAKPDAAFGNVYRSSVNLLWTYPKAFVEEPAVSGACTGNAWIGDYRGASGESKTDFQFRVFRGLAATADPSIRLLAIGRWK